MKSKIYAILIAFFMTLTGITHTMGTFFTTARKMAFSKWMDRAQWATFVGTCAYTCAHERKEYMRVEKQFESLYDLGTLRKYYLSEALFNTHPYLYIQKTDRQKVRNICESEFDRLSSLYSTTIQDDSVIIKHGLGPTMNNPAAFKNIFTGKKFIALPDPIHEVTPDGVLHHEYAHLVNNHHLKRFIVDTAGPLALHTIFKGAYGGYSMIRSGYLGAKNSVPSVGSTLLKIPQTLRTYGAVLIASAYYQRLHEQESDDAIPRKLAQEVADYLEKKQQDHEDFLKKYPSSPEATCALLRNIENGFKRILSTHPPTHERVKKLRARATTE